MQTFTETEFSDLPLHEKVAAGLADAGFTRCTPIQASSLPPALAGKDVAGQGQTGTGKTAAFLIATFNRLLTNLPREEREANNPRALILAPTRELAIQIHKDAELLGPKTGLKFGLAYGGIDYEKQRKTLSQGVDILIGTPGRIIDYFKQRVFHFKDCEVMVLDEADRMFDLGFIKDIRYLLRRLPAPEQRLNLMFSATLSLRVMELAYEHMNEPVKVEIESAVTADRVEQSVYFPSNDEKLALLITKLRHKDTQRTMVFCNTKRNTETVAAYLKANGFEAEILSGDVRQKKRQTLLSRFHDGELDILVVTDVAARGLHIPNVSHVINYDLPQDPEDYVHRIGRTARLGATGEAISFACEDSAFTLPDIEAYIEMRLPVEALPSLEVIEKPKFVERKRSGGRGKPGGGKNRGSRRSSSARAKPSRAGAEGDKPSAGDTEKAASDQPKRRRRRRRRRKSDGDQSDGGSQPTSKSSTSTE